jgi:chromosome segregation protein
VTAVPEGLEKEIRKLKNQMRYIGSVNPQAPQEYTELKQRHDFLKAQSEDLNRAITQLHAAIAELDEIMKRKFAETFDAVNVEFQKFFTLLFGGGTARLELTNPEDLTATGIDIVAKPPGKRAVHLAMLSGGERSLTAQALLFAILKVSPTPFCVLDEVDAMLDEANVGRFRDALRSLSGGTQFIVITHNRATIESADTLYGVSMGDDGVSQVISLRLAGVEKKLRQPARATPD